MLKVFLLFITISFFTKYVQAQQPGEKIQYIIDSIAILDDPEKGDSISNNDIAILKVIKNKDTLAQLGLQQVDAAIFIFTKAWSNRPDSLKIIPSSKQMERKNGQWLLHGQPYSGRFIDYYLNGQKSGKGYMLNGLLNGFRVMFNHKGIAVAENDYKEGITNGLEKEYYDDGTLKQKGELLAGKENGVWEMYYPNGQVKQKSVFNNGVMQGQNIIYYSTGKVLAVEEVKDGTPIPDKRLEKINALLQKGHNSYKEEDPKSAEKYYSKAITLDSTYAEAWFARGTIKLNEFNFDEAITDLDKALQYEPYMAEALANRAFARIRKYQFGSSRVLSKNTGVTVLASKDKVPIPDGEKEKICADLHQAVFLGDTNQMIEEAIADYCQ